MTDDDDEALGTPLGALRLAAVAAVAGIAIGVVGGYFRRLLTLSTTGRTHVLHWAHHWPAGGWLVPVLGVGLLAAVGRYATRLVPEATGSGIQNVEAAFRRLMPNPRWPVLPAKFVGGVLAIGAGGMALGREGPTVHMGATLGARLGRLARLPEDDCRILQAAIGGAGLGVAFNAPLGGALFTFEEVGKRFSLRLTLVALIGTACAIACSRVILGDRPNYSVGHIPVPPGWMLVLFVVFGALTGLLGALFNKIVLWCLDLLARLRPLPPEARAGLVGAIVGLVLWIQPLGAGGGDPLVEKVVGGHLAILTLLGYLVIRTLICPVSYSAGAPGGLFAPLLAAGAACGGLFQAIVAPILPASGDAHGTFAIVGMTALFAAVVRAPFTGVALLIEMTATTTLVVPMLAASFAAVFAASLVGSPPIYDSLRGRIALSLLLPT